MLDSILNLVIFLLVLGVLIGIHELGHFVAAKLCGIKVEEFAFGFPPRLWSKQIGETRYALNLLPLGGYVKLLGEDGGSKDPRSFGQQPAWKRLIVILAGVFMNLVLAVLALWIGFMVGMVPIVSNPADLGGAQTSEVLITAVRDGSPAQKAQIEPTDVLIGFVSPDDVKAFTKEHAGETVELKLRHQGEAITRQVTLDTNSETPLGVGLQQITQVKLGFFGAFRAAIIETGRAIQVTGAFIAGLFVKLFSSGQLIEGVSGPVGIYKATGFVVKLGFTYVLQLVAGLSIALALFNVVPIPLLDGGGVLFLLLEKTVKKQKVRENIQVGLQLAGLVILLLLFVLVTYRDIFNS